jgi:hypothetical protein
MDLLSLLTTGLGFLGNLFGQTKDTKQTSNSIGNTTGAQKTQGLITTQDKQSSAQQTDQTSSNTQNQQQATDSHTSEAIKQLIDTTSTQNSKQNQVATNTNSATGTQSETGTTTDKQVASGTMTGASTDTGTGTSNQTASQKQDTSQSGTVSRLDDTTKNLLTAKVQGLLGAGGTAQLLTNQATAVAGPGATTFDPEAFVSGIMQQATAQAKDSIGSDLAKISDRTGSNASGNSAAALLKAKVEGGAAANLAGIRANATATAADIVKSKQESTTSQLATLASAQDQGLNSLVGNLLQAGQTEIASTVGNTVGTTVGSTTDTRAGTQSQKTSNISEDTGTSATKQNTASQELSKNISDMIGSTTDSSKQNTSGTTVADTKGKTNTNTQAKGEVDTSTKGSSVDNSTQNTQNTQTSSATSANKDVTGQGVKSTDWTDFFTNIGKILNTKF